MGHTQHYPLRRETPHGFSLIIPCTNFSKRKGLLEIGLGIGHSSLVDRFFRYLCREIGKSIYIYIYIYIIRDLLLRLNHRPDNLRTLVGQTLMTADKTTRYTRLYTRRASRTLFAPLSSQIVRNGPREGKRDRFMVRSKRRRFSALSRCKPQ